MNLQHQITTLNQRAVDATRRGDPDNAEKLWREALQLDPTNKSLLANLGRLLFRTGRDRELLLLLTSDTSFLSHPTISTLVGESALRTRDFDLAIRALRSALRGLPDHPQILLSLSAALTSSGQLTEAISILENLCVSYPDQLEPALNLTVARSELGDLQYAEQSYLSLLDRHSTHPLVLVNAIRFYLNLGRLEILPGLLDRLKDVDTLGRIYPELAIQYCLANNDLDTAIQLLQQFNSNDVPNFLIRDQLIFTLLDQHQLASALNLIESACQIDAPRPFTTRLLAAISDLPSDLRPSAFLTSDFEPAELVSTIPLLPPLDPLLRDLQHAVRDNQTLIRDRPGKPTRGGFQSHEVFDLSRPIWQHLHALLKSHISDYFKHQIDHPAWRDQSDLDGMHLRGWAVILNGGGHQVRHTHPESIISGVLYLDIPNEITSSNTNHGSLWFSPSPLQNSMSSPGLFVKPANGLLVLFPSFVAHETIPFNAEGQRLCIAFDYG